MSPGALPAMIEALVTNALRLGGGSPVFLSPVHTSSHKNRSLKLTGAVSLVSPPPLRLCLWLFSTLTNNLNNGFGDMSKDHVAMVELPLSPRRGAVAIGLISPLLDPSTTLKTRSPKGGRRVPAPQLGAQTRLRFAQYSPPTQILQPGLHVLQG